MISSKQEKRIRRTSGLPLPQTTSYNLPNSDVIGDVSGKDDVMDDVTGKDGRTYGSLEEFGVDTTTLTESPGDETRVAGRRKLERTRVVILVIALSVHSLFEVGPQQLGNS